MMMEDAGVCIDYNEYGDNGPTVVLVPGSCSTGAAWRPVIVALNSSFRCVTTSLLGYGGTAERRTACDSSIVREAEIVVAVARKTGGPVHLVGHSFGGLVGLAVALRNEVALKSLVIVEAPAAELLRECNEDGHYRAFRAMTEVYFATFETGNNEAIASMIDFYGGDVRRFQLHLVESGLSICNRNRIMTGVRYLFRVTLRRHDLARRSPCGSSVPDALAVTHAAARPHRLQPARARPPAGVVSMNVPLPFNENG